MTINTDLCARLLQEPLETLLAEAEQKALTHHGRTVTYSRKVFIPLTQLCRDVCHYCTFARAPKELAAPYLTIDQVVELATAGQQAGCTEALFTLGDRPEARYEDARQALAQLGYDSTLAYLAAASRAVLAETGLLPHLNPGLMNHAELNELRQVSASMGIMLESTSERLCEKGGPHYGSPDKWPAARLEVIRLAGELRIPFTTGLLVGIGETRIERLESLLAIQELHSRYGHIQEVIIQNFRTKPDIRMAGFSEPSTAEHLWTLAAARILLAGEISVQAPPNLQPDQLQALIRAGVNDWGGVSPITPDHVNPERPWPHLERLAVETAQADRVLVPRLPLGPSYALAPEVWLDPSLRHPVAKLSDSTGLAREDRWFAGADLPAPPTTAWMPTHGTTRPAKQVEAILARALAGDTPGPVEIELLFAARGHALQRVIETADTLRKQTVGDTVTYVINRNINYTNMCGFGCRFCAFAKGQGPRTRELRGPAYRLDLEEIARRAAEAHQQGATEVCLQGGIHPQYTGDTYLAIVQAVKAAAPALHVHAFSPLEVHHGATTLGLPVAEYLTRLKEAGLATLPGTAAEILHDDVRRVLCPDKLNTARWLEIVRTAHHQGLPTTSTIMFGHLDHPRHWAAHLTHLRRLQEETGGITEFVPLPYVHMEAPLWVKGHGRSGPSFREALLMHAVGRIVLGPLIPNIQTSWVKMGAAGASQCLQAGANDLGGTLMNESITRAAGGVHGQCWDVPRLRALAAGLARPAAQRSTLYQPIATPPVPAAESATGPKARTYSLPLYAGKL